jgi:tRNA threonylcarbamoyladenosine modification (KEOPS) complex  Pcc1 subunit
MKKCLTFILIFIQLFHTSLYAQQTEVADRIGSLENYGQIDFSLMSTIYAYKQTCKNQNITHNNLADHMETICETVINSEICKDVKQDQLLDCSSIETEPQLDVWEFISGCANGIFDSAKELLKFVWSILKWMWSNATSSEARGDTYQQASEYINITKLYLYSEYDKAYEKSYSPFRGVKAAKKMMGAISNLIMNNITSMISEQYSELGCLNFKTKSQVICKFIGDIVIPPAALLALIKKGPKAIKLFPSVDLAVYKISKSSFKRMESRIALKISPKDLDERELKATGLTAGQLSYSDMTPLKGRSLNPIENNLKEKEIDRFEYLGGGYNETSLVIYEDGTKGVWKRHTETMNSNYRAEVLAYEFDQKIGFDLVPPTVERNINGRKGSIQLFVESKDGAIASQQELNKQKLLDYLIDNRDRDRNLEVENKNYLVSAEGRLVSIDNGNSFNSKFRPENLYEEYGSDIISFIKTSEGKKIVNNLRKLDLSNFRSEVNGYLGAKDSDDFIERIKFIISESDKVK